MTNIPHVDDVRARHMRDGGHRPRRTSLPRRDGQGLRRGTVAALLVLVSMISACRGTDRIPVNDADLPSPTRATVPPPSGSPTRSEKPEPFVAGTFDRKVVGEASGVAPSVRNAGWVYVLDDGPGTDGVLAVDTMGGGMVRLIVEGMSGRDTEGLAVGACRTGARRRCLFIGDIGNNQSLWPTVDVWRVREPRLRGRSGELRVTGAMATYTYPDAPVDAEALLVADGRPFLVTKERRDPADGRAPPPRLLAARRWGDGVLRDRGAIALPAPSIGLAAAIVGNVVTGGGVGDGRVILRTYDHVVEYTPPNADAPLDTLPAWRAREVDDVPPLAQPEGAAVDRCGIWLVDEQVDTLWLVPSVSTPPDDVQEQACPTGNAPS